MNELIIINLIWGISVPISIGMFFAGVIAIIYFTEKTEEKEKK